MATLQLYTNDLYLYHYDVMLPLALKLRQAVLSISYSFSTSRFLSPQNQTKQHLIIASSSFTTSKFKINFHMYVCTSSVIINCCNLYEACYSFGRVHLNYREKCAAYLDQTQISKEVITNINKYLGNLQPAISENNFKTAFM